VARLFVGRGREDSGLPVGDKYGAQVKLASALSLHAIISVPGRNLGAWIPCWLSAVPRMELSFRLERSNSYVGSRCGPVPRNGDHVAKFA
jgi:hypothetical protein